MSTPLLEKVRRLKQKSWRRRHPRYRADFPLKATALRDDGYVEIQGRCSDIGQGGIGAVLNGKVPPGEVVSLELHLPSSLKSLAVRTIVRYQKGFVHGLEFLGLTDEQQMVINTFCTGLEPSD